jgi:hypothetical protein
MADDERPDADDAPLASWLEVEPLDDVTRRRLVSTALREADALPARAPAGTPSRAWRWIAIAAAIVVVVAGGLALLTANGGHDEEQATRREGSVLAPESIAAASQVGDFGDLDQAANLDRLRAALTAGTSGSAALGNSEAPAAAPSADAGARTPESGLTCVVEVPDGATLVSSGTGTIGGRYATVVLFERRDGTRSFDALLEDPCEQRHLSGSS